MARFEVSLEPLGFAVWRLSRGKRVARVICEGSGTFNGYCHARHEADGIATRCSDDEVLAHFTSREREARMVAH